MSLLQNAKAIFHHPLDSAASLETVKSVAWTQTGGDFGSAKLSSGLLGVNGAADMTDTVTAYATTVGSSKVAFTGWMKEPSLPGAGYMAGGSKETGGVVKFDSIDKLTFSNDNNAAIASTLTGTTNAFVAGLSSRAAGYACGGVSGGAFLNIIDKMLFSNESVSTIASTLTSSRFDGSGGLTDFPSNAGYMSGGRGAGSFTTIDKLVFSGDTTSAITSGLTANKSDGGGAAGNGSTHGYFAMGHAGTGASRNSVSTIDKMTFSTESVALLASNTGGENSWHAVAVSSATAGYIGGGTNLIAGVENGITIGVRRYTFSDDTNAAITSTLAVPRIGLSFGSSGVASGVAGYFGGGDTIIGAGGETDRIDKLTFATEALSLNTSSLTGTRGSCPVGFDNV